nr:hypothetical protein [Salinispora sp. H7-4]
MTVTDVDPPTHGLVDTGVVEVGVQLGVQRRLEHGAGDPGEEPSRSDQRDSVGLGPLDQLPSELPLRCRRLRKLNRVLPVCQRSFLDRIDVLSRKDHAQAKQKSTQSPDLLRRPNGRAQLRAALQRRARPMLDAVVDHRLARLVERHPRLLEDIDGRCAAVCALVPLLASAEASR